ncbi:beta-N-acetylhexosaminidase [Pleomorphomonas diazotrophica]|uniref:beta-N-acetylhexosaminidase n=1 Tax=Pleomorphomonas diazotrophica TaxID=1166257 RepID=A0A1I4QQQ1_9HYPH|nr:family 20 glycosylhydrolase [Pleomorphomonas diazotrophica]PKR90508.1 beta-N-acetylhexosaminidase [Pleomorphomonas diazotrophica]SFM42055.1 hexosaminidase [Pleomorphomonas diazotrophica]
MTDQQRAPGVPDQSCFHVDCLWRPLAGDPAGRFIFELCNTGSDPISGFRLAFTTLRFVERDPAAENVRLLDRRGYFHDVAPPEGFRLASGDRWCFSLGGITGEPQHRSEGIVSAYVTLADGSRKPVTVGDLRREPSGEKRASGAVAVQPFALTPWPAEVALVPADRLPGYLAPADGATADELSAVSGAMALFRRLFPIEPAPFSLMALPGDGLLRFATDAALGREDYRLDFQVDEILVTTADAAGRQYALTALGQLLRGARTGAGFCFPGEGHVIDRPRFSWRGCHLDTARRFFPVGDLARFLDCLAYLRLNVFHWHLTDDEAWRLEIGGYPQLTSVGSVRGPDAALPPQLGDGLEVSGGFYGHADVRALVAHARRLNIEIVPEVDIPGHSTAALAALPALADPGEPADAYASVQGFANNALNPAVDLTWSMLEAVFDDLAALFPSSHLHVGGDEVAHGAWLQSPLAVRLMADLGINDPEALQSHFMRRVQAMLAERGRKLAGWNEVGNGAGVETAGTLLTVWQKATIGAGLARRGYGIVMAPAEAYYLDIAHSEGWDEVGMSWAGATSLETAYAYEVGDDIPSDLLPRLKGIQACLWTELIDSRAHFNHLVFPRLAAVAEAGWTPAAAKDWSRFQGLIRFCPSF